MAGTKTLALGVAAAALAAAAGAGYVVSEMRHAGRAAPAEPVALAAPRTEPLAAEPAIGQAEAEALQLERPIPAETRPPAPRPEPARTVAEPIASNPALPDPPAAPRPAEAVPAVTAAVPVATMPDPLGGLSAVPVPDLTPPVERIELVVERDSVIGVRLDDPLSSATAKVEDPVTATVTREVVVDGRTAIPEGSRVEGHVLFVEPGGKFREKARVGVQFSTVILPGNERLPIHTEAVYREGESPVGEATSKIGASAVVGTVLGAIIGGKKGAAIGGAAGAAGGTAIVAKGGTNDAMIPAGTMLTLRLTEPVVVVVERR